MLLCCELHTNHVVVNINANHAFYNMHLGFDYFQTPITNDYYTVVPNKKQLKLTGMLANIVNYLFHKQFRLYHYQQRFYSHFSQSDIFLGHTVDLFLLHFFFPSKIGVGIFLSLRGVG